MKHKIDKKIMEEFIDLFNNYSDYTALCSIRQYLKGTEQIKCNHLIRLNLLYIQGYEDTLVSVSEKTDYYQELNKFLKNLGFVYGSEGLEIASYV